MPRLFFVMPLAPGKPQVQAGGFFSLDVCASIGSGCSVQVSTNLVAWDEMAMSLHVIANDKQRPGFHRGASVVPSPAGPIVPLWPDLTRGPGESLF